MNSHPSTALTNLMGMNNMATRTPGKTNDHSTCNKDRKAGPQSYANNYGKRARKASRQAAALLHHDLQTDRPIKIAAQDTMNDSRQPRETRGSYTAPPTPKWVTQALAANAVPSDGVELVKRDGVDHINIGGRTELGLLLSHFALAPFVHPYFGPFNCMEGFWQYIKAEKKDDNLRHLVGWKAKARGRELSGSEPPNKKLDNFTDLIFDANYHRIKQNPRLRQLLVDSTLPFDHYYLFGDGNILIRPMGYEWQVEQFEQLRKMFKEGRKPNPIDYSAF